MNTGYNKYLMERLLGEDEDIGDVGDFRPINVDSNRKELLEIIFSSIGADTSDALRRNFKNVGKVNFEDKQRNIDGINIKSAYRRGDDIKVKFEIEKKMLNYYLGSKLAEILNGKSVETNKWDSDKEIYISGSELDRSESSYRSGSYLMDVDYLQKQ